MTPGTFSDPLDGLDDRPLPTQVAVMANEMRHQRNSICEMRKTLTWILRTLVGLLLTLIGGLALFIVSTGGHTP